MYFFLNLHASSRTRPGLRGFGYPKHLKNKSMTVCFWINESQGRKNYKKKYQANEFWKEFSLQLGDVIIILVNIWAPAWNI